MEVARQVISRNKYAKGNTVQDLKHFNSQFLVTQAKKKGEQLVAMMPAIEQSFDLIDFVKVELSAENNFLEKSMFSR